MHAVLIAAGTAFLDGAWRPGLSAASPVRTPVPALEQATQQVAPANQASGPGSQAEWGEGYAEELGIHYPTGPGLVTQVVQGREGQWILSMTADGPTSKWRISFQRTPVRQFGETPASRIEQIVGLIQSNDPEARLFDREALGLRIEGLQGAPRLPGELIYLRFPLKSGDQSGNQGIYGFSVNLINQNSFLYGNIFTDQASFEAGGREAIAGILERIRIEPEEARNIEQGRRMDSGSSVLARFTPEVLRSVAEDSVPEFYRIYERAPDGSERELGWQQVSTHLAAIEAVEIGGPRERPGPDEPSGLLVVVTGEVVSEYPEKSITIDVERRHWLALDRSRERWSMALTPRTVVGSGSRRVETNVGQTSGETGIRTAPQPRSTITIIDSDGTPEILDAPSGSTPLLSVAEPYVIGRLIKASGTEAFNADWYALDRSEARGSGIRKRKDLCRPDPETGGWVLTTRGPAGSFVQEFDARGRRIVRREALERNGEEFELILERIDPTRLLEIYAEKGLPTR